MIKEKTDKIISFAVRKSIFNKFSEICEKNYKTISEGLRELIVKKIQEEENKK